MTAVMTFHIRSNPDIAFAALFTVSFLSPCAHPSTTIQVGHTEPSSSYTTVKLGTPVDSTLVIDENLSGPALTYVGTDYCGAR